MSAPHARTVGRFEILDLYRDDGVKTFDARDTATGRWVQIHLFVHPGPDSEALLWMVDMLSDDRRHLILDRGNYQGIPYIATDVLAGSTGFREWLLAQEAPLPAYESVDLQFAKLFEDDVPAPAITGPDSRPKPRGSKSVKSAAKSLAALVLGVTAALLFLALVVALYALKPR